MPEKYRNDPLTYFQARNVYLMEHSGALELVVCQEVPIKYIILGV